MIEDLVMAVYLPIVVVMLAGASIASGLLSVGAALAIAGVILVLAMRFGEHITRLLDARSDEALLLGVIGITLLVAGITQQLDVSAAVGAFLVGIAISGPVGHRAATLVNPLRDLFAALFFILFGFRIDPESIPDVLPMAAGLLLVATVTKVLTGWWAAKHAGIASSRPDARRHRARRARRVLDRDRGLDDRLGHRGRPRAARSHVRAPQRDRRPDPHEIRRRPRPEDTITGRGRLRLPAALASKNA